MPLLLAGASLQNILEEQYYLASKSNIPISDSNYMVDFERTVFVNLLMKEMKQKRDNMT